MVATNCSTQPTTDGASPQRGDGWQLSRDLGLLLDLVSPHVDDVARERVARYVAQGVDWSALVSSSRAHRITPLLFRGATTLWADVVPQETQDALRTLTRQNTFRNMMLIAEYHQLIDLLTSSGIDTIAYKGPVLTKRLYDSPGLRLYGDLDLLVPPRDAAAAMSLLAEHGYEPVYGLDTYLAPEYLATKREARMLAPRSQSLVEIQWRVAAHWEIPLAEEGLAAMWARRTRVQLGNREVNAFGDEDLVVVLCAHAACHCFEWTSSICDIAELINQYPEIDWIRVKRIARDLRVWRMVLLAVYLARKMLRQPVPSMLQHDVDASASTLARLALMAIRAQDCPETLSESLLREARMHIGVRESWQDKVVFGRHYAEAYLRGILSGAGPTRTQHP